jgi:hypothetical protein
MARFTLTNIKHNAFNSKGQQLMLFREAKLNSYLIREIYGTIGFAVLATVQSFLWLSRHCGTYAIILHFDDTEIKT